MTLNIRRDAVPQVLSRIAASVEAAGGRERSGETTITGISGAPAHDDTASIALTYVGIPGFSEQAGEAMAAFVPTLQAGFVSTIFLLPALAPWLVVGGLLVLGIRTAWRRSRRSLRA